MSETEETESLLRESIAASNRTTRAVRALVRFLFVQFFATLVAVGFWALGLAFEEVWLLVAAFIVLIVGLIWASTVGLDELAKSDPDSEKVNQNSPAQTQLDDAFMSFRKTAAEFDAAENRGQKSE